VNIIGSFILGLDNDDLAAFRSTLDFVMKNRLSAAQYHILTPFPGTRLYERMDNEQRILERDWAKYHTSEVVIKPAGMSIKELQDGYDWLFRKTYTWPNILNRVFRSPRGILYRIAINMSYRKKALKTPIVSEENIAKIRTIH
jgi:radical SAM superfamily enzyme YgiQ (UPF0313 family)